MLKTLRHASASFVGHQGFFLAAGLSFYFIICMLPLLFLIISLAGFLLSRDWAATGVIDQLTQVLPVYRTEISALLTRLIETKGISGVLGTAILVLFSTQLFASLRLVLNRVLEVQGRGFLRGVAFDLVMILLIIVFFIGTVVMTALFGWFRGELTPWGIPSWLWEIWGVALAFVLSVAMFFLLYRFLPSRWVSSAAALFGAVVTSLLWELAKQLFRLYIQNVGVYDRIYGPLGILMALVMFIYYSGLVFIYGAELIRAWEVERSSWPVESRDG